VRQRGILTIDNQTLSLVSYNRLVMPEESRTEEEETPEHMARSAEPKESLTEGAGKALQEAQNKPTELERIAVALERSAVALEQIGAALWAQVPPEPEPPEPEPPDALPGDVTGGTDVAPPGYRRFGRPGDLPRSPEVAPPDDSQSDRP
jgi:hypothetical protein